MGRRRFQIAASGCFKGDRSCSPYVVLRHRVAQKIIPLINERPMSIRELSAELDLPTDLITEHIEKMLSCRYVEEVQADGKTLYKPAFTILTLEDQRRLQPLLEELSSDITAVIAESMPKVREAIKQVRCIKAGYELPQTEYIVIMVYALTRAFSEALEKEGYVIRGKEMPSGYFIVSALEEGLIDLGDEWTWGHFSRYGRYEFATHGAPAPMSVRHAFPDLLWAWTELVEWPELSRWAESLGDILIALVDRPILVKELASQLGRSGVDLLRDLTLLRELEYIQVRGYGEEAEIGLAAPVFTVSDVKLIEDVAMDVSRELLDALREKYYKVEEVYRELSPARNGIDLHEAFEPISMIIRIVASRKLIEGGVIKAPPIRKDGGEYTTWVAEVEQ